MDEEAVRFEPVSPEEHDAERPEDTTASTEVRPTPSTEATPEDVEPDRFPLAGPILEGARPEIRRGRCSGCDSRLRVRIEEASSGSLRVRCPICGRTGEIEL